MFIYSFFAIVAFICFFIYSMLITLLPKNDENSLEAIEYIIENAPLNNDIIVHISRFYTYYYENFTTNDLIHTIEESKKTNIHLHFFYVFTVKLCSYTMDTNENLHIFTEEFFDSLKDKFEKINNTENYKHFINCCTCSIFLTQKNVQSALLLAVNLIVNALCDIYPNDINLIISYIVTKSTLNQEEYAESTKKMMLENFYCIKMSNINEFIKILLKYTSYTVNKIFIFNFRAEEILLNILLETGFDINGTIEKILYFFLIDDLLIHSVYETQHNISRKFIIRKKFIFDEKMFDTLCNLQLESKTNKLLKQKEFISLIHRSKNFFKNIFDEFINSFDIKYDYNDYKVKFENTLKKNVGKSKLNNISYPKMNISIDTKNIYMSDNESKFIKNAVMNMDFIFIYRV